MRKQVYKALFRDCHPLSCVYTWQGSIVLCHYSWSQTVCSNFQEILSKRRVSNSGRSFSPFTENGIIAGNMVD